MSTSYQAQTVWRRHLLLLACLIVAHGALVSNFPGAALSPKVDCTETNSPSGTCSGHGSCGPSGRCICHPQWHGPRCTAWDGGKQVNCSQEAWNETIFCRKLQNTGTTCGFLTPRNNFGQKVPMDKRPRYTANDTINISWYLDDFAMLDDINKVSYVQMRLLKNNEFKRNLDLYAPNTGGRSNWSWTVPYNFTPSSCDYSIEMIVPFNVYEVDDETATVTTVQKASCIAVTDPFIITNSSEDCGGHHQ